MLVHDAFADPESQTSTGELLRRVEGFEEVCEDVRADAFPGVGNRDSDTIAMIEVAAWPSPHNETTATVGCIECITNQVVEHLPYLALYAKHRWRAIFV